MRYVFPLAAALAATAGLVRPASAQLTVTPSSDAAALADAFTGTGVTIVGAPTLVGAAGQQGFFNSVNPNLIGFESGVVLSTGLAGNAIGPNTDSSAGESLQTPGDADLSALINGQTTNDANSLTFQFTVEPGAAQLNFNFVFASEEYNEFVGSDFNDVFGFFVDGQNVALIPGTATPVAINTVNAGYLDTPPSNPQYYRNNDPFDPDFAGNTVPPEQLLDLQADGLTVVFTADVLAALDPSLDVHTIKLAIADTSDDVYDSWVFLSGESFSIPEPTGALSMLGLAGIALGRRRK